MKEQRARLGRRLLQLRKAKGWSQEDAAHAVGVGVKTWHNWEAGKRTPYDSNLRKIGEAFDVDPASLLERVVPLGLGQDDGTPPAWAVQLESKIDRLLVILDSFDEVPAPSEGAVSELGRRVAEQVVAEVRAAVDEVKQGRAGRAA